VLRQIHHLLTRNAVLAADRDALLDFICERDDEILARFLTDKEITPAQLHKRLTRLTQQGEAFPVLTGSALKNEGVAPLLDAIAELLPPPTDANTLCGVVFAAQQDRMLGRGVWVRLYSGRLENRTALNLPAGMVWEPLTKQLTITVRGLKSEVQRLNAADILVQVDLTGVENTAAVEPTIRFPENLSSLGEVGSYSISVQITPEPPATEG
jgi:translation elongation factor EF-G